MEVVVKMESIPVDGAGEETVLIGAIHISLSLHIPITARGRKILDGLSRRVHAQRAGCQPSHYFHRCGEAAVCVGRQCVDSVYLF